MVKQEVLVNKDGRVVPKRDIFMARHDTKLLVVDAPEGASIVMVKEDGTVISTGGAVVAKKTTKAKAKKVPKKSKPAEEKQQSIEDVLDGLDDK